MSNTILELYHAGCRVNSEFHLRDITFSIAQGTALAIMGKNASGKSTLFSMLMGIFPATAGEIHLKGEPVKLASTQEAVSRGILLLGQNQAVFENMKVYENIYFGNELMKGKLLDNSRMCSEAAQLLSELKIPVHPMQDMQALGQSGRQLVSLARAMCTGADLILMDEPSTYLGAADKKILWDAVDRMKAAGKSFLFISHDPAEVLAMGDYVAFMESGVLCAPEPVANHTEESLIPLAYAMSAADLYRRDRAAAGDCVLEVSMENAAFSVRRGEVVALVGDSAAAQNLLSRLGGLAPCQHPITICGKPMQSSPLFAITAGVSLALDDAAEAELSAARELLDNGGKNGSGANLLFRVQRACSSLGGAFGNWVGMGRKQEYTTGGCRRREIMERALARRASLYALFEPSAGLDLPSRIRLYHRFGEIATEGAALVFATSNLTEALGIADRLIVLRGDTLLGDIPADRADEVRALLK